MTPRAGLRQWLVPGASTDLLGLRWCCERRLVHDLWCLPRRRTWLRVLARASWEAGRERVWPAGDELTRWLEGWMAQEFEALAGEQAAEGRDGRPASLSPDAEFYRFLGNHLGTSSERAREACVLVNRLDVFARRTLVAGDATGDATGEAAPRSGSPPSRGLERSVARACRGRAPAAAAPVDAASDAASTSAGSRALEREW